jgi:hypothetical protein
LLPCRFCHAWRHDPSLEFSCGEDAKLPR